MLGSTRRVLLVQLILLLYVYDYDCECNWDYNCDYNYVYDTVYDSDDCNYDVDVHFFAWFTLLLGSLFCVVCFWGLCAPLDTHVCSLTFTFFMFVEPEKFQKMAAVYATCALRCATSRAASAGGGGPADASPAAGGGESPADFAFAKACGKAVAGGALTASATGAAPAEAAPAAGGGGPPAGGAFTGGATACCNGAAVQ